MKLKKNNDQMLYNWYVEKVVSYGFDINHKEIKNIFETTINDAKNNEYDEEWIYSVLTLQLNVKKELIEDKKKLSELFKKMGEIKE